MVIRDGSTVGFGRPNLSWRQGVHVNNVHLIAGLVRKLHLFSHEVLLLLPTHHLTVSLYIFGRPIGVICFWTIRLALINCHRLVVILRLT
jgi:hypothetical protein